MNTIDMECPACGRMGTVPRNKANSRLVCRKCNQVFHMSPLGRPVPGEPPTERADPQAAPKAAQPKDKVEFELGLPKLTKNHAIAAGALLLAVLIYYGYESFVSGPGEPVTPQAQILADALRQEKPDVVKQHALPGTEQDAAQFYSASKQKIDELRKLSPKKDVTVSTVVTETNILTGEAEAVGLYKPAKGTARESSLATAAGFDPLDMKLAQVTFLFTRDSSGHWKLDGKRSLSVAGGAGAAPAAAPISSDADLP